MLVDSYRELNAPKRGGDKGAEPGYGAPAAADAGAKRIASAHTTQREDQGWPDAGSKESDAPTASWGHRIGNLPAGSPTAGSGGHAADLGGSARARTVETGGRDAKSGCLPDDCSCEPTSTRISKVVVTEETVQVAPDGSTRSSSRTVAATALDQSNAALMGDAPACDVCGSITVRNGTCYRCLNCGNSMGCS